MKTIEARKWDDLPFHLGVSCYWLAYDAMAAGRLPGALALLEIVRAFGDLIVADYPQFAMTSLDFKWAAVILKAHILGARGPSRRGGGGRCSRSSPRPPTRGRARVPPM